jgi:hypothetical protein
MPGLHLLRLAGKQRGQAIDPRLRSSKGEVAAGLRHFRFAPENGQELPAIADVAFGSIVLQKSFCLTDRKFSGL